MQKMSLVKKILLPLLVCLLVTLLWGCDMSEPFGSKDSEGTSLTLSGAVNCYAEPDVDAEITASFANGLRVAYDREDVVTINGVEWVKIEHGWVMLSQPDTYEEHNDETLLQEGFVTAKLLNVRSAPGEKSDRIDQLPRGTQVFISETAKASDGLWGKTAEGWIYMGHVYLPGEKGENTGYAVVREKGAKIYSTILDASEVVKELKVGARVAVLEQIKIEDDGLWVYADGGWIREKEIYIEGTAGKRPCTGIVDDTTPLNVRVGPGTDYDINTALPDGTYVQVLERITRKKHDWGFVGDGWIYMDNVDIGAVNNTVEIVGSWQDFHIESSAGDVETMWYYGAWDFSNNGTFKFVSAQECYRWIEANEADMEKVEEQSSSEHYTYSGTYTFDGKKLVLTYTASDDPQMPSMPHKEAMQVTEMESHEYEGQSSIVRYSLSHNSKVLRDGRSRLTLSIGDTLDNALGGYLYRP